MKTLLHPNDKDEVLARLQSVHATTPRRWGKMSAHQMVCHLADGFRLYMSLKTAPSVPVPYPRIFLKWAALWAPIPWPKGFKTAPELDQQSGGTPPAVFDADLRDLQNLVDRFTRQPRDFEWQPHPHFGRMSDAEWSNELATLLGGVALLTNQGDETATDFPGHNRTSQLFGDELELLAIDRPYRDDEAAAFA